MSTIATIKYYMNSLLIYICRYLVGNGDYMEEDEGEMNIIIKIKEEGNESIKYLVQV